MVINLRYEDIDQFTIEECKIAKLELQVALTSTKERLSDWREGIETDYDGEHLERRYRHLRRLLHRLEIRMMQLKQQIKQAESIEAKEEIYLKNEANRKTNEAMFSALKPKPYHFIFCGIARDVLDQETFNKIHSLAKQKIEKLKSELG